MFRGVSPKCRVFYVLHFILKSHSTVERRFIESTTGAIVRYLPPYSPDYNPIELGFGSMKAYLKRMNTDPNTSITRTNPKLACKLAMRHVSRNATRGFFRRAGYDVPTMEELQELERRKKQQMLLMLLLVNNF